MVDARIDRISRATGEVVESKPARKYAQLGEPEPAAVRVAAEDLETRKLRHVRGPVGSHERVVADDV